MTYFILRPRPPWNIRWCAVRPWQFSYLLQLFIFPFVLQCHITALKLNPSLLGLWRLRSLSDVQYLVSPLCLDQNIMDQCVGGIPLSIAAEYSIELSNASLVTCCHQVLGKAQLGLSSGGNVMSDTEKKLHLKRSSEVSFNNHKKVGVSCWRAAAAT